MKSSAWDRIGKNPHHGFDLHIASLRTENSCGVGEYLDLLPLIDWCKSLNMSVIQLLPLNDSGFDPSPYNALSSVALNPIYISLYDLEGAKNPPISFDKFNHTKKVDYEEVRKEKLGYLYHYFETQYEKISKQEDYKNFVLKNEWLGKYAIFKVLKGKYDHTPWSKWPDGLDNPSHHTIKELIHAHQHDVNFHIFMQYLCYIQLSRVKIHAREQNVFIKGDIPILINPESADVWTDRHYFLLEYAAGAPPDQFNPEGQYWGFPLYNWPVIEKDDYNWWVQRLRYAQNFYDIYRIDHIIGFFRIWVIERGRKAIYGQFMPREEWAYLQQGTKVLSALIECCDMLPIGADLGIIPDAVYERIANLHIAGTKVPRWMRDFEGDGHFIPYNEYPSLSLTTVSTHDSDTLEQWWQNSPEEVKAFCEFRNAPYEKTLSKHVRFQILKEAHQTPSLFHINLLQEYLALHDELIWENPDDERINIPGYILPENWTYRFKKPLEEFTTHEELNRQMRELAS